MHYYTLIALQKQRRQQRQKQLRFKRVISPIVENFCINNTGSHETISFTARLHVRWPYQMSCHGIDVIA